MTLSREDLEQPRETCILSGWGTDKPLEHHLGRQTPDQAHWSLVALASGRVAIEEAGVSHFVPAPVALLISPGCCDGYRLPASQPLNRIVFTVSPRPRSRSTDGSTLMLAPDVEPQPTARQAFGIDLPAALPDTHYDSALRTTRSCAQRWWRSPLDHLHANHELAGFLLDLVDDLCAEQPSVHEDEVIDRVLAETRLHLASGIDVQGMAALIGIGRVAFNRRFTRAVGISPSAFLAQERLARAQRLLRQGKPVGFVAAAVGFRQPAAFCRFFARHLGESPRAWLQRERLASPARPTLIEGGTPTT